MNFFLSRLLLNSKTSLLTQSVVIPNKLILFNYFSDKTVRVWRWNVGKGFVEEIFSPLLGHKYGVTCVKVSPQVIPFEKQNYKKKKFTLLIPSKENI